MSIGNYAGILRELIKPYRAAVEDIDPDIDIFPVVKKS